MLAFGAAPILGFWVYHHGWVTLCVEMTALNVLMAVIAWLLRYVSKNNFTAFVIYRLVVAAALAALVLSGRLNA